MNYKNYQESYDNQNFPYGTRSGSSIYYEKLDNQNVNKLAKYIDSQIVDIPTTLVNQLPVDISVFLEGRWSGKTYFAGILKEKGTLQIPYNLIEDGDLLHFKDLNQQFFIVKSHKVIKRTGKILVGNVAAITKTFKRDVHPGADLSSISFYNMLRWPLIIYMATGNTNEMGNDYSNPYGLSQTYSNSHVDYDCFGKNCLNRNKVNFGDKTPAAILDANEFLGNPEHHGDKTMAPSVYFDNLGYGINIGTMFHVVAIMREKGQNELSKKVVKYLYTFTINSTDNSDIFIGDVNPIIGESNLTEVSPPLHEKNTSGRAIYRLGEKQSSMGNVGNMYFPSGERMITPKNYSGMDKTRNTINNKGVYSTVPSAKYKMISGNNVVKMCG